jgi:cellulose synthase/poly-beta-1,6-N-acetylglucosamine synthase-like glycosyltransferase
VSERTIDLSILMPVYDERATVDRAIEAELGASYELIVVDDGSRDGTGDLLHNRVWPDHVRLLVQGKKLTALDGFRVVATLVRCRLVS